MHICACKRFPQTNRVCASTFSVVTVESTEHIFTIDCTRIVRIAEVTLFSMRTWAW
jgi:hypothetical protein